MQEQSRAFQVDYLFEEAADWAELPLVGLRSFDWGGVPRVTGGVQAMKTPQHLGRVWEMQRGSLGSGATRRNEHRIKADGAQDWKCMPFLVIAACPQRCDADG